MKFNPGLQIFCLTNVKPVELNTFQYVNCKAHFERETGLEPATNSLEGCDSSQLSYSRTTSLSSLELIFNILLELSRSNAANPD